MPNSRLLLATAFLAAVLVTAASGMLGSTAAAFTDRAETTVAFTAHTLPAPSGVAASFQDDTIVVTWQPGAGDVADHYEVYRREGACDGWTPSGAPLARVAATAPSYTDASGLQAGSTYCYAVRGTSGQWVSPTSTRAAVTIPAPEPVSTTLYLHADGTLQGAPGSGGEAFTHGDVRVFRSTSTVGLGTSSGWRFSVALTGRGHQSASLDLGVQLWYVGAGDACGTSPASHGQLIASGTASRGPSTNRLVFDPPEVITAILHGNPTYQPPSGPHSVCAGLSASVDAGSPHPEWYSVAYGASSWIEGPVAP